MNEAGQSGEQAAPAPSKLTVGKVAKEGLVLYHNLNKLDRWGGGGFGLSTLVKLAGWSGLIAILGTLVVKLRSVESQLDPVTNGVDELRAELDQARKGIDHEAGRGKQELEGLRDDAAGLRRSVQEAKEAHAKGSGSLSDADRSAKELSENLRREVERGKALDAQQDQVAAGLGAYQQAIDAAKTSLAEGALRNHDSLTGLDDSLHQAQDHAKALDHDVSGLSVQGVKDELARVDAEAKALEVALHTAAQQAHELDRALELRLEAERHREAVSPAAPAPPEGRAARGPTPPVAQAGIVLAPGDRGATSAAPPRGP